jgi:hypothetical protein
MGLCVMAYRRLERSRTRLIQADRANPALVAAASYSAFLEWDTRKPIQADSPLSTGGLPLGRLVSMP